MTTSRNRERERDLFEDFDLDPAKFYQLVDIVKSVTVADRGDLLDFQKKLHPMLDDLQNNLEEIARAGSSIAMEEGRNRMLRGGADEASFEDRWHASVSKDFLGITFEVLNLVYAGYNELLDLSTSLPPGRLLLSKKTFGETVEDFEGLQHMLAELSLNKPTLVKFTRALQGTEKSMARVTHIAKACRNVLESYYKRLLHRHSVDGIEVHGGSAVATDVSMTIYDNVDHSGEIEDGKNPEEVSRYTRQKAEILAKALKGGLMGQFISKPEAFNKFVVQQLTNLSSISQNLTEMFKTQIDALRGVHSVTRMAKTIDQEKIDFAMVLMEILEVNPESIVYREKTLLLSPEERFALKFRNETLRKVVGLLTDPTENSEGVIAYILERKAEIRAFYQDENSFYVCKIGSGNPFSGEAPGALTVIPGTRPISNLDTILGSGFAEVRQFFNTVEASSQFNDLFVATSPSSSADKSNVLLVGPQGCHRKGQRVLMYDGTLEVVERVQVGDLLMGPDSGPRKVLKLHCGVEGMVEITPIKGTPWVVNKGHLLTLVRTCKRTGAYKGRPAKYTDVNEIKDISVGDYLTWSKTQKHIHRLFRVGVDFKPGQDLPLDAYFLGVLLGDGCLRDRLAVTNEDSTVIEEVYAQAKIWGLQVYVEKKAKTTAAAYHLTGKRGRLNPITKVLRTLGLFGTDSETKFVPHIYKVASRKDRLALIAGLLDTDGHLHGGCYDYVSKSSALAHGVAFMARSLGLAAYVQPCRKSDQNGTWGDYFRVGISGHIDQIPVRVPHKKAGKRKQVKDVLRTDFTTKELPPEEYFGFSLDGDHRYLLDDFTVTHNCGKSEVLRAVGADKKSLSVFAQGSDFLTCWKGEAEKNPKRLFEAGLKLQKESKKHVHFLIDEIDAVLNADRDHTSTNLTLEFQILMDGVVHYPNLSVWGATNNPERIPMPMIRRFSKVLIVGELSQEDRIKLLQGFVSYLPHEIPEAAWADAAQRLEGATGDVVRKIADSLWRMKIAEFTGNRSEEALSLIKWLNDGERFDVRNFTKEKREQFIAKLRPFVSVSAEDLMETIGENLDNFAIYSEIETAKVTYSKAKAFLSSMNRRRQGEEPPPRTGSVRMTELSPPKNGAALEEITSNV